MATMVVRNWMPLVSQLYWIRLELGRRNPTLFVLNRIKSTLLTQLTMSINTKYNRIELLYMKYLHIKISNKVIDLKEGKKRGYFTSMPKPIIL